MHILFIGQLGVQQWPQLRPHSPEWRVEAVARHLALRGHQVSIVGTKPYLSNRLAHRFGITVIARHSFSSTRPGGWQYILDSLWTLWRLQPQVVHLHGWRAGALAWLAALLSPETTLVWTIASLPNHHHLFQRIVLRLYGYVCDAILVPSRTLQYVVLHRFNVRVEYIPDGYDVPILPDVSSRYLGVKKGQYSVVLGSDTKAVAKIARVYAQLKTKKKLMVLSASSAGITRLIKRYPFITRLDPPSGRSLYSLLRSAATIIVADTTIPVETILQAMHRGTAVIAPNAALYQETLGVTGLFYRPNKPSDLLDALKKTVTKQPSKLAIRAQTQVRAQHHFTWERITADYLAAYNRLVAVPVPVDSAQRIVAPKLSVTTK